MCSAVPHRHSIFCIVPPFVLRNLARAGAGGGRVVDAALRTLAADSTFRSLRAGPRLSADLSLKQPAALAVEGTKQRTIFTAENHQDLPGRVVRAEKDKATGDKAVDEAFDGFGATYDFYWQIFDRNSINDEGLPLNGTVHFGQDYDNAFWDGQRMVFGDGDGEIFQRFTISIDVIGHELTHGVTEDEAQLMYQFQSGALNESVSDVFGSLVKQWSKKQTADKADWLIGEGLFVPGIQARALRDMKNPGTAFDDPKLGKDQQPGNMKDYLQTFEDNGGVHINSGIPNRAFCLAAMNIGGYAWEKTGKIWYETLRDPRLRPNTGFRRFARLTQANAVRLYSHTSSEAKAVADAWAQVGIKLA
jgi:Zn-dependent metalloprotease